MADTQRTDELLKRVLKDPTSIAFAQLAEEYRREGRYQDAIETCRGGLAHHPLYLSARVTLGRAHMELEQYNEAQREFDLVLEHAPDNLAAIRALAEIHQRRGDSGSSLPDRLDVPDESVAASPVAIPEASAALPGTPNFGVDPQAGDGATVSSPALTELEDWLGAIVEDRSSQQ